MEEFIATLSLVANLVTVLAGVIALAGVLWASLSRAKLTVTPSIFPALTPQLTITVASTGSNPVHDLEVSGGALDNNGFSMWADRILHRPVLARGQWLTVAATGDNQSHQRSPVIESEYRHPMTRDEGAYLNFQWRSPLFPWRRSSVTYVWPPSLRFASRNPRRLTGRAESRFFRRASDQQNNDSHLGFRPPKWSSPW